MREFYLNSKFKGLNKQRKKNQRQPNNILEAEMDKQIETVFITITIK